MAAAAKNNKQTNKRISNIEHYFFQQFFDLISLEQVF